MKIYVPLVEGNGKYRARTEDVDIRDWRDENFLEQFEEEIVREFDTETSTVSIDGTEFKNCRVHVPKNEKVFSHYIMLDEDFRPIDENSPKRGSDDTLPDADWVSKWLVRSRNSDVFFHNYQIDLPSKYIAPVVEWDDESQSTITHPSTIRRDSRILLVGQPGAGKTSFVRYLTQVYLNEGRRKRRKADPPLVFYFQLRDFAHKSNEFETWLVSEEEQAGRNHVVNMGADGKTLFVFDGLDELNVRDRSAFGSWLEGFLESRPSSSTIVTSRQLKSLDYGLWGTFKKAKLHPFSRAQVNEYCQLVLEDPNSARRFTRVLDANPDLREFLKNPFSLSLALGMFRLRGSLPFNIGVLCRELVAQLIERWDARRGIDRDTNISVESIQSTLGRLAYRLQSVQGAQFEAELLEGILPFDSETLGARAILQEITDRTGIIQELNPDTWAFSHRYFQDFFCASYLVERASGLGEELNLHGRDGNWVDVWRQVGQLCQDPEFFALSQSRSSSDAIKSVDRMVSSILSHDGLSKLELIKIVDGLTEEMMVDGSNLPDFFETDFGAELDCRSLDEQSVLILAKTVTHLSYLRDTSAGRHLLEKLEEISPRHSSFAEVARLILLSPTGAVPVIQLANLQIHFERLA
ncbi:NACHT domain-containing NTPase [Ruegeria sp. YS9]|uniref:NACHT domain-containing protein n=1 Tax=Ruegeria sp. YS9 TaxID=2966453 RepID=UPI00214C238B|nr:NACHT domain-containing protein [Ruegeria sp. YS9]UUV06537.1 NACHT domain-containing protein [Ruegeria sp. YS9]